jgi:hypothetical protein
MPSPGANAGTTPRRAMSSNRSCIVYTDSSAMIGVSTALVTEARSVGMGFAPIISTGVHRQDRDVSGDAAA